MLHPARQTATTIPGRSPGRKPQAAPPTKTEVARAVPDLNLVRERMRGWIALAFVVPLGSVVPFALLGLLFGRLSVGDVKDLLASLGMPQLVCIAMGFYFGRVTK